MLLKANVWCLVQPGVNPQCYQCEQETSAIINARLLIGNERFQFIHWDCLSGRPVHKRRFTSASPCRQRIPIILSPGLGTGRVRIQRMGFNAVLSLDASL